MSASVYQAGLISQTISDLSAHYAAQVVEKNPDLEVFQGCSNDIERTENLRELTYFLAPAAVIGILGGRLRPGLSTDPPVSDLVELEIRAAAVLRKELL